MELGKEENVNFLQVTYGDDTKGLIRLEHIQRMRSLHPSLGKGTVIHMFDGVTSTVHESLQELEDVIRLVLVEGW